MSSLIRSSRVSVLETTPALPVATISSSLFLAVNAAVLPCLAAIVLSISPIVDLLPGVKPYSFAIAFLCALVSTTLSASSSLGASPAIERISLGIAPPTRRPVLSKTSAPSKVVAPSVPALRTALWAVSWPQYSLMNLSRAGTFFP